MSDRESPHSAEDEPASELEILRKRLVECEQRLAVLPTYEEEARLAGADRDELDRLREELDALRVKLAEVEALRGRSEAVAEQMKASLSWRLTAPLRRLKRGT